MSEPRLPRPSDPHELERLVARFAQSWLRDPAATRYGRSGQVQWSTDVLARDRRPDGNGGLWAFEAKHRERTELTSSQIEEQLVRFADHPLSPSHLVFVTTSPRSTALINWVEQRRGTLPYDLQLWFWESFEALVLEELGAGPWLSAEERQRQRRAWCERVERDYSEAGPLHPLQLARNEARRLRDLFVPPRLRWVEGEGGDLVPTSLVGLLSDEQGGKPCILLVGDAGSGKSALLLQVASELAGRARLDLERPLPLLLRASDLERHGSLGAEGDMASLVPGGLWDDPVTRWDVLADGLDELSLRGRARVERRIQSLLDQERVRAVAVSCRSGHAGRRVLPSARRVALQAWSAGQVELFWERWHGVGGCSVADPLGTRNPLELTLVAQAGLGAGATPRAYLKALDGLVHRVIVQWAEARAMTKMDISSAAPLLQRLAWSLVRGHPVSSEGELLDTIRERGLAGQLEARGEIERAERELGLFFVDEDGTPRTSLRLVIETLASYELAGHDISALAQALGHPATSQTARIALLRRLTGDGTDPMETFAALLAEPSEDDPAALLRRAVQLARVAPLLPEGCEETVQPLAELLLWYSANEQHHWWRRVAGVAVSEAVSAGGALGQALVEIASPLLAHTGERACWFETYQAEPEDGDVAERGWEPWASLLEEQDPAVRAVAVRRLAPWKDEPAVRALLEWALLDEGLELRLGEEQPSLVAGSLFRELERDDGFAKRIPGLRSLLNSRHQQRAGAAALALRPGEAPAEDLLRGLRLAWMSWLGPRVYDAVRDLLAEPGAAAWKDEHWRDFPDARPEPSRWPSTPGDRAFPPCSTRTQRDLWRQLAPYYVAPQRWRALPDQVQADGHILGVLCDALRHRPDSLFGILQAVLERKQRHPWFPPPVQDALGQLLLERPALVKSLRKQWDAGRWSPLSSFPGIALERLVEVGDPDAVELYCQWLPHSPALEWVVRGFRPPSRAVLANPHVCEVACAHARDVWRWASDGRRDQRGEVSRLAPCSLGHLLGALWPSWREDVEINEGLLDQAMKDDAGEGRGFEWFDAALSAWRDTALPSPLAARLSALISGWQGMAGEPFFLTSTLPRWIELAGRAGLLVPLTDSLESMLSDGTGPAGSRAAIELARLEPERAVQLSRMASELWPAACRIGVPASVDGLSLIGAAPGVWAERLLYVSRLHGPGQALEVIGLARALLDLPLQAEPRKEIIELLYALTGYRLLWLRGEDPFWAVKVSGAAEELLYELGEL